MKNEEVKALIIKYNSGKCTDSEKALVEAWFLEYNEQETELSPEKIEEMGQEILRHLPKPARKKKIAPPRKGTFHKLLQDHGENIIKVISPLAAVVVFLFLWHGIYKFLTMSIPKDQNTANVILPGSNKATLILSNGKKINLSDAKRGIIIDVNELTYSDGTPLENKGKTIGAQTLSTPIGGQYQLLFKDGTKIWLNAASTLTFKSSPSSLAPREVSLTGEAYFEIAKDKNRPFKVHTADQVVEVLGTHFNVSSYKEDAITKTTLLEGSVKVNESTILSPGEQSALVNSRITVQKVDTDNAVAWKNGEFMFRNEALKDIMPKLARWYNVEISYKSQELANKHFGGTISKFKNVAEVLDMLELTGEVHFKIEGRRILVMP